MKPKTTIILAVLLLACLALALFSSDLFTSSPKKTDQQVKPQPLFVPAPGKITELTVTGRDGKIVFTMADGNWRIVQPIAAKAETWRVDEIANAMKDLKGTPAEGVADDTTGLDKPLWTVTAVDDKKATYSLEVGRTRPMKEDQTYVRLPGAKKAFIAEADLARKLDRPVKEYRNSTVLDVKADQVERLAVTGKDSFELIKRDGAWAIAKPFSAPADANSVRKVVDQACRVAAAEFVADAPKDLAPYGLDKPRLIVDLQLQAEKPPTPAAAAPKPATGPAASKPAPPAVAGKTYGLAIGASVGDKCYAKLAGEPAVFKVNASLLTDLQPKLTDLRVRQVLPLKADDVTGVDLEMPEGKATLVKKDGLWMMTAPLEGKADPGKVAALLAEVGNLKADSFNDNAAALDVYGLDKPAAKLTFRQAGKGEAATLLVGTRSRSGEMTFVKTATGLSVGVVKTADLKALLSEPATYWDRTILKLPDGAQVTRMQLRRVDDTFTLDREASGDWALRTPLAAPADKDTVNKLLDRIENLQADKIVNLGKSVPESFAKATDIMQIVVTAEMLPPTSRPATRPAATRPARGMPLGMPPMSPMGAPGPTATPASGPVAAPATKPADKPATKPAATQPASKPVVQTYQLTVVKVGLHTYAWLAGTKIVTVGEFPPTLYDELAGELRSRKVWAVEPEKIQNVRLTAGADSLELRKDGKTWSYPADAYVKIDEAKVDTYLKDLAALAADKFLVQKTPADLKKYGLDKPWMKLELTDKAGAKLALTVSNEGQTTTKDRYAVSSTVQGVFLLPASSMDKLGKTLKDFKK